MKYTAIYDVSKAVLELVRSNVVPDIVMKAEEIGLCSPANHGDAVLGIYLYNIEESESFRLSGRQNETLYEQRYPPVVLDLYYMITPYFKSDVRFLAEQELTLFGKIIQTINDNSLIFTDTSEPVELEMVYPPLDDKQKIWNGSDNCRTSLYMRAKAVIIESLRTAKVSRVTDVTVIADQKRRQ